ncbi:MAG: four-carbon acid sugar kinase family protein [Bacillota bacterium]|nr:four-carbon acid sugar kinase family protein [Bacillota bacterium]
MKQPFILADDLTGAMDTGVQLTGAGLSTGLIIRSEAQQALLTAFDVLVLDTESRNISPDLAADAVRDQVDWAIKAGNNLIYKKIDSTLRGNIGYEIEATLTASGKTCALVAPAMPGNGRTTRDGRHYVHGLPLLETEFAKDPFAPIFSSSIPEILAEGTDLPVSLLPVAVIRQGVAAVGSHLQRLIRQGIKIIVADAEVMSDLAVVSEAIKALSDLLPCGAADLLRQLILNWTGLPDQPGRDRRAVTGGTESINQQNLLPENGSIIVLSGSPAQISKKQIAAVSTRPDTTVINIDPSRLIDGGRINQDAVGQTISNSRQALAVGRHVVIDASGSSKDAVYSKAGGDAALMMRHGNLIRQALGELAFSLINQNRQNIGGLVIFGGDTSHSILEKLETDVIQICGEVEPYIPEGRLIGGLCDGLRIVTKAGGFGNAATLDHILTIGTVK